MNHNGQNVHIFVACIIEAVSLACFVVFDSLYFILGLVFQLSERGDGASSREISLSGGLNTMLRPESPNCEIHIISILGAAINNRYHICAVKE